MSAALCCAGLLLKQPMPGCERGSRLAPEGTVRSSPQHRSLAIWAATGRSYYPKLDIVCPPGLTESPRPSDAERRLSEAMIIVVTAVVTADQPSRTTVIRR